VVLTSEAIKKMQFADASDAAFGGMKWSISIGVDARIDSSERIY